MSEEPAELASAVASQPARAVWIEMPAAGHSARNPSVTACEGCVD